jgi:prepilin-type N-terminal cleavage/methylation domain-containing protein
MRRYVKNNKGFTLIELILVIAMVGVLASIAGPSYLNYAQRARATQCSVDRGEAQNAIVQYYHDHPDIEITSLQQLIDAGYLPSGFNCPLEGEYVLIPAKVAGTQYPVIACSLHYMPELISTEPAPTPAPTPKPLTSLGSSFEEISQSMIDAIKKFYQEKGKYPRSGAENGYTDIGLDPAEWENAINGIIYRPQGDRISISPGSGYTFFITSISGEQLTISETGKMIYSMETNQWYYTTIKKGNVVNISTLQVKQK